MIRLVPFFVALLLLYGCGTTFKVVPVDSETGRFPTSDTIKSEDLIVNNELQLERYKKQLYVMVVDGGGDTNCCYRFHVPKMQIDIFFEQSFQETGFSEQVQYIPQYFFERIIFKEVAEKRALAIARSREFSSELAALKERHKEGAIDDKKYMQKQREIVNAQYGILLPYQTIVSDLSGLHLVQEHYREHLVVGILVKRIRASYRWTVDMKVLDPATGDTVFHAHNEAIAGHLDRSLFYPLFNAFIDWIEKNSGTIYHSLFWEESGRERPEYAVTIRSLRIEFRL